MYSDRPLQFFRLAGEIFNPFGFNSSNIEQMFDEKYGQLCLNRPWIDDTAKRQISLATMCEYIELLTKSRQLQLSHSVRMLIKNSGIDDPFKLYSITTNIDYTDKSNSTINRTGSGSEDITKNAKDKQTEKTTAGTVKEIPNINDTTTYDVMDTENPNITKSRIQVNNETEEKQVTTFEDTNYRPDSKMIRNGGTVNETETGTNNKNKTGTETRTKTGSTDTTTNMSEIVTETGGEIINRTYSDNDDKTVEGTGNGNSEMVRNGTDRFMWEDMVLKQLQIDVVDLINDYLKYIADNILFKVWLYFDEEECF